MSASSTLAVKVVPPPPETHLELVDTKNYKIDSPLWNSRAKALIVNWIPHCIEKISDPDLPEGGINNFIDAANKLAGKPHGKHRGYVFSNAWVYNTIESICVALMVDPQGDREIIEAQKAMRATLDDWIPKILAAQEPDGYLQTFFTLGDRERWSPRHRGDHEGYVAGYFLEAAVAHYLMTNKTDARLYDAAKKLADCWCDNLGPPPKKPWYDGHQAMEIALVRFGRFVNEVEGDGKGDKYIELAKFLLDCRKDGHEYDQSHVPVVQQYEAVGHAVRAVYSYAGMADVAMETGDVDYQSAVMSLWDNIVNRKYYVTGGVGSGETSEGFGPDYSLRHNAYCESCSSCGEIFFQHKLNLTYHDAKYADLYEETLYNALLGLDRPGGQELLLPEPARFQPAALRLARLPVLRGQHPPHPADAADLDVQQERRQHLRQPVHRQHRDGRGRRRHRRRDGPDDGLSLERQGVHHRQSGGGEGVQRQDPGAQPQCQRALHRHAAVRRHHVDCGQRFRDHAAGGEGLRRDHPNLEGRRQDRSGAPDEDPADQGHRQDRGDSGPGGPALRPADLQCARASTRISTTCSAPTPP